jgi:hypothetical protein
MTGSFSAIAANLTDVSTSLYHSCVLGAQVNFISCWGAEGMSDGRASVPNGLLPISVSTGRSHTCTTNFNNAMQCFGDPSGFGLLPSVRFAGAAAALNITCGIPLDVPAVVRRRANAVVVLRVINTVALGTDVCANVAVVTAILTAAAFAGMLECGGGASAAPSAVGGSAACAIHQHDRHEPEQHIGPTEPSGSAATVGECHYAVACVAFGEAV